MCKKKKPLSDLVYVILMNRPDKKDPKYWGSNYREGGVDTTLFFYKKYIKDLVAYCDYLEEKTKRIIIVKK